MYYFDELREFYRQKVDYHKHNNFKVLDIMISTPISYEEAKSNRTSVDVEDIKIHLIGLDDLIKMKEAAGRKQDVSDIEALQKLKTFIGT